MAAEASRSNPPTTTTTTTTSSGGSTSTDSYIGSLISLTSKSEIRYEGILFTINTQEASIGLRNVRSFGTEGRRVDGQVPASDKVYEYIVFRGSDIKDLQVKSSPPVQTAPPVHNDPAIIQSNYTTTTASSNLPTASVPGSGSSSGFSNQISQPGAPVTTYPNSVPMYPPVGNMPQWNPSPTTNASGHSMPMYWPGYYNPSGPSPAQQQPLLRPVQGLSVAPPTMNLSSGASNVSFSQSSGFPPPLLHPAVSSSLPMQTNLHPVQSSAAGPSKAPSHVVSQSPNSPLVLPNVLDKTTVAPAPLIPNQAIPISSTSMPFNDLSESVSASVGPALVTPGQFLQPEPISSSGQTEQKDVEVVQDVEAQPPLLPLPPPTNARMNVLPSRTHYVHRGGHDRRRGNEFSHPVANFTEDFDFEAMNEKFKKDEVWGHLGKSNTNADDGLDLQYEEDVDVPKADVKPVYKKDDFFDTLSSNAMDRENRNGRPRFSEQMRLDTETFGNFPRNRGFRGGRGPGGGRSRGGGYYGRGNAHAHGYGYGYGNAGRGGRGNTVYRV